MSEKIYIWLLKLYPAAFREEYGVAAVQLFRDRLLAERGVLARCRLWFDLIVDLAVSIPREYGRRGRHIEPQPGVYRFSEEAIAARMNAWKSRLTVMLYFYTAVLLGAGIGWVGGASHLPLLATYGLLAAFGTVQYYRRTSNFKRFNRGYELIVETARVQQKYAGGQSVTVFKGEVTGLIDCDRGLGILTGQRRPAIMVPCGLSGYEEVREHLASWMPIVRSDYRPYEGRRTSRLDYAAESLILVTYVPAVLVRSEHWFLPLALISAAWLYTATRRQRRERRWMKGVVIPLVVIVPLVANAIALLRPAR
jgi:hypothetical protein